MSNSEVLSSALDRAGSQLPTGSPGPQGSPGYQPPDAPLPQGFNPIQEQNIWVTFKKHGVHRYPDAPEEVAYLRSPHRHLFGFKVEITVFHDDREIEFHMFQNWLLALYDKDDLQLDYKSCEMIAQDIIQAIYSRYDCTNRTVTVEVDEDGECGARVTSRPYSVR